MAGMWAVIIKVGAVPMFQKGTFLIGGERAAILSAVEPLTGVMMGGGCFSGKGYLFGGN